MNKPGKTYKIISIDNQEGWEITTEVLTVLRWDCKHDEGQLDGGDKKDQC